MSENHASPSGSTDSSDLRLGREEAEENPYYMDSVYSSVGTDVDVVNGNITFVRCHITGNFDLSNTIFTGRVNLRHCTVDGRFDVESSVFLGSSLDISNSELRGDFVVHNLLVASPFSFTDSRLVAGAHMWGDFSVYGSFNAERSAFEEPLDQIRLDAYQVDFSYSRLKQGGNIGIRCSRYEESSPSGGSGPNCDFEAGSGDKSDAEAPLVILESLRADAPFHVEAISTLWEGAEEKRKLPTVQNYVRELRRTRQPTAAFPPSLTGSDLRPQLIKIGNDVSNLTLSGLDLSPARFYGIHSLDKLKIEQPLASFARTPRTIWWTRRAIVSEERFLRASRFRGKDWQRPETGEKLRGAGYFAGERRPDPSDVADIYRALRKGREDAKDEPGAADFYYGEMEMRRIAGVGAQPGLIGQGEKVLLWAYWLTSGYSMRSSRAIASLTVTLILFTLLFHYAGFADPAARSGFPLSWDALVYSASVATSTSFVTEVKLTTAGQFLRVLLKVLGPAFIGLVLLAFRGRVKR